MARSGIGWRRSGADFQTTEFKSVERQWILSSKIQWPKALQLLSEARRRFAAEKMFYDVALAMLEESILLLGQNRADDVKSLTLNLAEVFGAQGINREALAALRLFQRAVEKKVATAELARQVLDFLFRSRHNESLSYEPCGQP